MAAVDGAAHGLFVAGVGKHIQTEGAPVARVGRFEKDDAGVHLPGAVGADGIVGKALAADLLQVRPEFGRQDRLAEAQALDAGKALGQVQAGHEGLPLVTVNRSRGVE